MTVVGKLSALVSAAAVALLGWAVPVQADAAPDAGGYLGAVTLVTGDRVTLRQVGRRLVPAVEPGPGRGHLQFATAGRGAELLVVPADAWTRVQAGQVDRRLFDVAGLIRAGYGDEDSADLPLIVPAGTVAASGPDLSTMDLRATRLPKADAVDFWNTVRGKGMLTQGADRIWLDGLRTPSLDVSVRQIGAPIAWESGYTGAGVKVAVLDTGADTTHPDLRGRVAAARDFVGDPTSVDEDGHGTHVASTIAGSGRASDGKYAGVAPGARLLIGKVCGRRGCPESAILAGMAWAVQSGAKVVNLSLGGPDTDADDLLETAVDQLSAAHGTLFVVAAGNDGGYGAETVSSPASADAALAVGAVDRDDALARFSARGPRVRDAALKPEIVAPGVDITAARSRFSDRGKRGEKYTKLSGTSMATPHVAGAAAILAQRHPDWTGHQLKAGLMASAAPIADAGGYEQGAGRVDVARAVVQTGYAEPAAVSMGRQSWPHDDDPLRTETVSYHNTGDAPLTLRLSLTTAGPDREPAPEGMFRLSATEIVVPPHGRAGVEVTVDTSVPAAEGAFSARVLAESGAVRMTTPIAVDREPESYDLTLRTVDGNGELTDYAFALVFGVDLDRYRPVATVGGAGTVRVRKGRYHVDAVIGTLRPDGVSANSHKVVHPTVDVAADTTVVLDAAAARPITVAFGRPGVLPKAVGAGYGRTTASGTLFTGVLGDTFERIFIGQVGDPLPEEEFVADIGGVWAVPDRHGDFTAAPVTYNLAWFDYGGLPAGFARTVADADLAEVATTYREQTNRRGGTKLWIAREPRFDTANGYGIALRLPLTRTEYHNVDDVRWSAEFQQWRTERKSVHTESVIRGGEVDHQPGQSAVEEWNSAVFGPALAGGDWASRSQDTLSLAVPMYGDAGVGRSGQSDVDSAKTVLYRDGVKLGETELAGQGSFEVPPESASYTLETTARRSRVSMFSTEITCVWTFTSARPEGSRAKGGTPLPLLAVRFAPPGLDDRNRVRAESVRVPVTVQRLSRAAPVSITELTVSASYDDGRTWRPVPVTRAPGADVATAEIDHPRSARYVSLRATATDSAGDAVEQTVLRAYGV
ncbi:S8 family peptidase [Actinokineospora sp.]|uniref:S8 family peptidase n=1 Tax=Actinokineospora sp. TaxID=1872133 RepID=UPI0040378C9E